MKRVESQSEKKNPRGEVLGGARIVFRHGSFQKLVALRE